MSRLWLLVLLGVLSCAETPHPTAPSLTLDTPDIEVRGIGRGRGNQSPSGGSNVLSLNAGDWSQYVPYNTGKARLTSPLSFVFPLQWNHVGYLWNTAPPSVISGTLAIEGRVTGSATYYDTETRTICPTGSPAKARPFFIAHNNWNQAGHEWARWWSNPIAMTLADGAFALSVPVDPSGWSSVYGQMGNASPEALAGFEDARTHVTGLGVTFGCGSFFAHGISATGNATFAITRYEVMP